jgi:hypothetical protein
MGYFEENFAMYSMRYNEMISRESTRLSAPDGPAPASGMPPQLKAMPIYVT